MSSFSRLLGVRHPIVQAPMAGVTTPELVAAVSSAGGLGSFGGALSTPDALRAAIREIRALTDAPFAVNLFAPLPVAPAGDATALREMVARHGVAPGEPAPPIAYDDQLAVVLEERVPVFSFTFGRIDTTPLREAGIVVLGTATTAEEGRALAPFVDAVVAQGAEAGGHRGTFIGSFEQGLVPLGALVPTIDDVPVVAAGGIVDGAGVARALALGAAAAQLGTAFLFSPESAASPAWRQALREHETVVTRAYTGRHARAARTPFLDELMEGPEPLPYPQQAGVLAPLRTRDGYGFYMGGTGAARARELPAAELVRTLVVEMEAGG